MEFILILIVPVTITLLDPGFPEVLHIKYFSLSFAHLIYMCTILPHSLYTVKFLNTYKTMFLLSCGNSAPFILSLTQSSIMYKHSYLLTIYMYLYTNIHRFRILYLKK